MESFSQNLIIWGNDCRGAGETFSGPPVIPEQVLSCVHLPQITRQVQTLSEEKYRKTSISNIAHCIFASILMHTYISELF